VVCDITDRDACQAAVRHVIAQFGRIDVLVNNAGIIQVGPLESMTEQDFNDAMKVHYFGPLQLILAAVPHMRRQGGGRIVNVASIGGRIAVPHLAPYCASKFALVGLSDAIRSELRRHGIYVTTVFPGLMRTGSIYQAEFKGRHEAEFAWFGVMGSAPLISMNAERAARQIVNACRRGAAELVVGIPAKAACMLYALLPETGAETLALAARCLPAASAARSGASRKGADVRPENLPAFLTRLSDSAALRNNQVASVEI
jgi:NAD(P)-dependent dehydrogenase (short-subunit alcohol dehydrogenase family)